MFGIRFLRHIPLRAPLKLNSFEFANFSFNPLDQVCGLLLEVSSREILAKNFQKFHQERLSGENSEQRTLSRGLLAKDF